LTYQTPLIRRNYNQIYYDSALLNKNREYLKNFNSRNKTKMLNENSEQADNYKYEKLSKQLKIHCKSIK